MLKVLGLCISFLVIGITVGTPTKDIEELFNHLEELRLNHYVGGGRRPRTIEQNNNSNLNGKPSAHHAVDLEEKPLLYEYFANTLNPIIDRRNFEELDNHLGKRSIDTDSDRYVPKRFFLERPRALPTLQEQQQKQHNFHEVDKDYQEYMKRMLNDDRIMPVKRNFGNFDEIDRYGLNRFAQTSPYHSLWSKRNIDEIDRYVPQIFTDNKREEANNYMTRGGKLAKYV